MLLPGPEAQKLATYIGWLLHGVRGGLSAGILFVLPGAFVMLGLSLLYALGRGIPLIDGALVRHQGGGAGDRDRGADPHRQARAQVVNPARSGRGGIRRHLLFDAAVSADRGCSGARRLRSLRVSRRQQLGLSGEAENVLPADDNRWRHFAIASVVGLVAW